MKDVQVQQRQTANNAGRRFAAEGRGKGMIQIDRGGSCAALMVLPDGLACNKESSRGRNQPMVERGPSVAQPQPSLQIDPQAHGRLPRLPPPANTTTISLFFLVFLCGHGESMTGFDAVCHRDQPNDSSMHGI